ncbi:MAG: WXG100 family type VII secretion target [Clostridiales bacterium]|nr:WXG100 family type VII secretion target [Clostridiales bacterium]
MSQFQVTASELTRQAETLTQLNQNLQSQITVLENTEASLMGMWEGEAKNAFHNAFQNDKAKMQNFKTAIDQYVAALQNIAAKYAQAEAANVNTASTRNY